MNKKIKLCDRKLNETYNHILCLKSSCQKKSKQVSNNKDAA